MKNEQAVFQDAIQGVAEREIDEMVDALKEKISAHVFSVFEKYGGATKLDEKEFHAFAAEMANFDSFCEDAEYILPLGVVERAVMDVCYDYKKIMTGSAE